MPKVLTKRANPRASKPRPLDHPTQGLSSIAFKIWSKPVVDKRDSWFRSKASRISLRSKSPYSAGSCPLRSGHPQRDHFELLQPVGIRGGTNREERRP